MDCAHIATSAATSTSFQSGSETSLFIGEPEQAINMIPAVRAAIDIAPRYS